MSSAELSVRLVGANVLATSHADGALRMARNVLERLGVPTGGAIGQIALLGTFTASVIADGVAAPRSPVRSP
jgi:hypothetical protein